MERALGLDVSHWKPVRDWKQIPSAYRFIGIKASEGATNVDPTFAKHRDGLRGLPSGTFDLAIFYHLARPGDGTTQAARLLSLVGQLRPNERLALDTERTSAVDAAFISAFFGALPADRRPILYTSNGVWVGMRNPSFMDAARVDLWLPRYGSAAEPMVPDPWHQIGKTWTFWQRSDSAAIPGVDGAWDESVFNGDQNALRTYASLTPPGVA